MGVATAVHVLEVNPHANFLARQLVFDAVSTSLQLRCANGCSSPPFQD
jgi:hypothetical protein